MADRMLKNKKLWRLASKYPRGLVAVVACLLCVSCMDSRQSPPEASNAPFDSSQCNVYTVGTVAGAVLNQFRTTDGSLAYVLVTNRESVVSNFERNNINLWMSREEFQRTEYAELIQVLPPAGVQELNQLISVYPYVAMAPPGFAKSAQPLPAADPQACTVD